MFLKAAASILIVVTSHGTIDADHKTGLWMEEFSIPYYAFRDAGCPVTVASPKGGRAPVDPRSMTDETKPEKAEEALKILAKTVPLDKVDLSKYDAVFFPGGHGTMFDLPDSKAVTRTVEYFLNKDMPIGLVCHGPAALVNARDKKGQPAVKGRRLTAFTNSEENATGLKPFMPFLLQSKLEKLGAEFNGGEDFKEHVIVDDNLVTGQNPASSALAAEKLLDMLKTRKK